VNRPGFHAASFDLVKEYEPLPETTRVITPSGGMHLYCAMPEGEPPLLFKPGWLPGVDIPWVVPVPPSARLVASNYLPIDCDDRSQSRCQKRRAGFSRTSGPGLGNDNDPSVRNAQGGHAKALPPGEPRATIT
jgi:hypothetical protein